jgi:hypothetical protein
VVIQPLRVPSRLCSAGALWVSAGNPAMYPSIVAAVDLIATSRTYMLMTPLQNEEN